MNTPTNTPASSQAGSSTRPVRRIKAMRRRSSFRTPVPSPINPFNLFSAPVSPAKIPRNPFKAPPKPIHPPFNWRANQPDLTPRDREIRRRERKLSFRAQKRLIAQATQGVPAIGALFPSLPTIMALPNFPFRPMNRQALTPTSMAPPITPRPVFVLPQPRPLAVPLLPQRTLSSRFQPILPTGDRVRRPSESSNDSDSTHTSASSLSQGRLSPEEYEQAFEDIFQGSVQGSSSLNANHFDRSLCQSTSDTNPSQLPQESFNRRRSAPSFPSRPSQTALGKRRASFLDEARPPVQRRRSTPGARPRPRLFRPPPIRSRRQTDPGPVIENSEQLDPFTINMNIHYRMLMQELGEHRRLEGQIIQTMDSLRGLTCAALDMTHESISELEAMRDKLEARRGVQGTASRVHDTGYLER